MGIKFPRIHCFRIDREPDFSSSIFIDAYAFSEILRRIQEQSEKRGG